MSGIVSGVLSSLSNFVSLFQSAKDQSKAAKAMGPKTADGRRVLRIACLGHAHSGKTTYWTVLHEATRGHSDKFGIQSADNATAAYLIRQREAMQEGAFYIPAPGEKIPDYEQGYPRETDQLVELLFFARGGGDKEAPIVVQDYPGRAIAVEDLDGRGHEVVEWVKKSDGILFFMDSVATRMSPQKLAEQVLAFNSVLKHVENRKGFIDKPVGLVFTRADRLDEFRPANPTEVFTPADRSRKGEVFSRFLQQLLRGEAYNQDPAWKGRLEKTLTRLGSFVDSLLKKTRSSQIFFVSAVGEKIRRPIEVGGSDASIATSLTGSSEAANYVVGRHQVGMEEPVRWLVRELSVMKTVYSARDIRNRVIGIAACWAILVSLPFMGYLGCAGSKVASELSLNPVHPTRALKAVHEFEENLFVKAWSKFFGGYLPTARAARLILAQRGVDQARVRLLEAFDMTDAVSEGADMATANRVGSVASFLDSLTKQLPDTTADYKDAAIQARCLKAVATKMASNFRLAGAQERQQAFVDLYKLEGTGACMNSLMRERSQALAMRIKPDLGRGGAAAAGGGAGAPPVSLKEAYNTIVAPYGPGSKPESRVNAKLIGDLRALLKTPHLSDPGSVAVEQRANKYLAAVAKLEQGTNVTLRITQLSSPATMKVAQPGSKDFESKDYGEGDDITLKGWSLGKEVRIQILLKDYSPTPYILEAPDMLITQAKQRLTIPMQSIRGAPDRNVVLQYEIEVPKLTDETVPVLDKVM